MACSSPAGIREQKLAARRGALGARARLGARERARASEAICQRLLALPEFAATSTVMGFAPMAEEVDIAPALAAALGAGKRLLMPRVNREAREICPREVRDLARELKLGYAGISEPALSCPAFDPRQIGLVVVPAAAVGHDLSRLGYGGGFYDRFLASAPQALKVAAVFSVQLLVSVPVEAHDAKVDRCLTEAQNLPLE